MIIDKVTFLVGLPDDLPAILALHEAAFGRADEAVLVRTLLQEPATTLDLCAKLDGKLVGHILLTELEGPDRALALAPVAVDPDWRDFQIGTELIRQSIASARQQGWKSVFVLGDPVFYGRFGFRSDMADCVNCPFQGPYLQALELENGALDGYVGKLVYPEPFMNLE